MEVLLEITAAENGPLFRMLRAPLPCAAHFPFFPERGIPQPEAAKVPLIPEVEDAAGRPPVREFFPFFGMPGQLPESGPFRKRLTLVGWQSSS
jgi:hypothetical protein